VKTTKQKRKVTLFEIGIYAHGLPKDHPSDHTKLGFYHYHLTNALNHLQWSTELGHVRRASKGRKVVKVKGNTFCTGARYDITIEELSQGLPQIKGRMGANSEQQINYELGELEKALKKYCSGYRIRKGVSSEDQ